MRNGFRLDYCWQEAVKSLLPICDEVVICDCDSDDGTRQAIDEWAAEEPKINTLNFPWTDPVATNLWWPEYLNYARQHLKTEWHVQLDADEILHEDSYEEVLRAASEKRTLMCERYNFYRDARHLVPHGECLGHRVIRVGPANMWMPSDYPDPNSGPIERIAENSGVKIMHYGCLRKRDAYFKKARVVHKIWVNSYDQRLVDAENFSGNWMDSPGLNGWMDRLLDFSGTHPKIIHPWLKERGYDIG